jgi:type I restriction enzyme S subunit
MFESISQLAAEIEVLTKTRDLLLPRLISGKLSVEDLDIQFPPSMCEEAA